MRTKTYKCDDCGATGEFSSYVKARGAGWAVSKDYAMCYCPNCAPKYRKGAAMKANMQQFPTGWVQVKMEL